MSNRKIIFISTKQYGYLTAFYYYSLYLNDCQIEFICIDRHLPKYDSPENVHVQYCNRRLFSLKVIRYLWTDECRKKKPIIIVNYYKLCGLIGLCNMTQSTVLDIRSGEISRSGVRVFLLNALIWVESLFYKRLFIISENLRLRLKLSLRKAKLIPLGAIEIGYSDKSFKELNLLYVGTFFNREIHLTVRGLAKFKEQHPEIPIKYTIIGFGPTSETELILREIKSKEILEGIVDLYGRLNHRELKEHFKKSNIGVSFVPQTDYFHCQPPTKTFEYICSGLVCIATATNENKQIIDRSNGVIISDTPESFANGLEIIWANRNSYNSQAIKTNSFKYHWSEIVENHLRPALKNT